MERSPRPKSPPGCAKQRHLAQLLITTETEIRFLEQELKFIETLQPASFCIKQVADYVVTNPEPLTTVHGKTRKSCGFWKWLCCFNMSCVCCRCNDCSGVTLPCCSCCCNCSLPDCCSCSLPKCNSPSCSTAKACLCSSYSCPKCTCCWPTKCKCWCPKCSCSGCCSLQNSCCCSSSPCQCCC